ncbi:LOW QUALITY PROTEIN: A-kinase anchor protein 3 [Morphnus guianensis]
MMVGILCCWEVIHALKPAQVRDKEDYHEKSQKDEQFYSQLIHAADVAIYPEQRPPSSPLCVKGTSDFCATAVVSHPMCSFLSFMSTLPLPVSSEAFAIVGVHKEFFLEMLRKISIFRPVAGIKRLIQESDPLKMLSWFQKHPESCAFSIDDALKSIRVMEIQDNHLLRGRASNSAVYHQEDSVSMLEEVSFYADRLSNLVIATAHKEINEKSDGPDPCFAVLGKPSHKFVGLGTNKDKNNPSANVTHVNMKETRYEESPPSKNVFYKEINQSSNRNELFQKRRVGQQKKEKCHKHFGQDEFPNNLSKEILIYANNVVSVMVVSVMKTMEGQANYSNIACIVLNLLVKHSKAVVSDLIDSRMKNLHDIAGKLMTNSDFASSVKLTLFTLGSHKAAEIVQALLNHFHSTLIVQKTLAYASMKTGSRTDAKAQMRSAATRTETLPKEKEMTCADAVGNHIIKQGFTLWHENQNQCIQCSNSQPKRELKQDHQRTCPGVQKSGITSDSQKSDTERQKLENDMSSATLMLIWKLINKNRRGFFACKVESQPGNPIVDETNQNTGKTTKGHIGLSDTEQSCEEVISGPTKMLTDQLDLSREDSSSTQFIGSLVDTVLKLCLVIVKYSNSESLLAESGSREDQWALGAWELLTTWLDPVKVLYQDTEW